MTDSAIETHQLSKVFVPPRGWRQLLGRISRARPVTAVTDLTLSVPNGELFGLLGPNGAGKTTLVKMLCTLVLPTSGSAHVTGYALENGRQIRAATGLVVSDERSFFWRISARRNLDFFAALHGLYGAEAQRRIDTVLAEVGLLDVADRTFSGFSSGMKQRLAIARALLHQPRILFLDEPSRSLDPTATRHLHELILRLRAQQELTIFLITHDLAEAENLCTRVALMHQGRIRKVGRPAELKRTLQPQQRYVLDVDRVDTAVLAELRQLVPTLRHEPAGAGSRLTFRSAEEDGLVTAVIDCLRRHQLRIHSIEATPLSLEEVFAHYTQDVTG